MITVCPGKCRSKDISNRGSAAYRLFERATFRFEALRSASGVNAGEMREVKERREEDEEDGRGECKVGSKSLSGTTAFIGESAIFFAEKTITLPNRTCTSKTRAASRGWRGTLACRGRRLRWLMEDK